MVNDADISENNLLRDDPVVLQKLLLDHTTHKNIFWATDSYAEMGDGYRFADEITTEHITGEHGRIIMPRAIKSVEVQNQRAKDMAEVFTPAWICNAQNNLIDEAWFGRKNVFNIENESDHTWTPIEERILFAEDKGKTWQDYVKDTRLEMTCGEGPYLMSRYDAVTGNVILPLNRRIGLLDRKLRVVSENTTKSGEWLTWGKEALMATYGFEWQGDNLLLAREAAFYTFCDYYEAKFGKPVPKKSLEGMAYIISWNLWQMDGLKMVLPGSCGKKECCINQAEIDQKIEEERISPTLFNEPIEPIWEIRECEGCKTGDVNRHNGIYCRIKDWSYTGNDEDKQKPFFITLLNNK